MYHHKYKRTGATNGAGRGHFAERHQYQCELCDAIVWMPNVTGSIPAVPSTPGLDCPAPNLPRKETESAREWRELKQRLQSEYGITV